MAKGRSSGISFDEYMRKKKNGEDEEKSVSKSSSSQKSTEITKNKSGKTFADYMFEKNGADKVDGSSAEKWFSEALTTIKGVHDYSSKHSGGYDSNFGGEYTNKIKKLLGDADVIQGYLKYHRDEFDDYDSLYKTFSQYRSLLSQYNYNINNTKDYYSQWETEDDYNKYLRTSDYEKRHQGKTYGDIQKTIGDLQKSGGEYAQEEIDWLNNHSKTRGVIDTMTSDEIKSHREANEARKAELIAEKNQLEEENRKVPVRPTAEQWKEKTARDARIKEIYEELSGNSTAYYEYDGTAVTYDNLYRIKSTEEDIDYIQSNPILNAAYEAILTYEDPLKEDNDIHRMENAMSALSARQDPYAVTNEGYEEDLQYIVEKYGIDPNGTDEYIKNEIYKVYNAVGSDSHAGAEAQKQILADAGYDWGEIEHYRQWQADKERSAELKKSYEMVADDYGALATIASIVSAPGRILDASKDYLEVIRSFGADDDSAYGLANVYDNNTGTMLDAFNERGSENVGKWMLDKTDSELLSWLASSAYGGVTSSLQSATTTAVCVGLFGASAGPAIAMGIMGSQAGEAQYVQAIKNGSTHGQAWLSGLAAGAAEAIFEKYSIEGLVNAKFTMDTSSFSNMIKSTLMNTWNVGKQGLTESAEELFTSIANNITDGIINGDHSSYNTAVDRYVKSGMTYAEAQKQASIDYGTQLLGDALGGFFGGISSASVKGATVNTLGAIDSTAQAIQQKVAENKAYRTAGQNILDNNTVADLVKTAQGLDNSKGNKELKKLAEKVAGVTQSEDAEGGSKSVSKRDVRNIGKLYSGLQQGNIKQYYDSDRQAFTNKVRSILEEKGVDNVDKATEVVVKGMYDSLSVSEKKIFDKVGGKEIINSLANSEELKTESESVMSKALKKHQELSSLQGDMGFDVSANGKTILKSKGEDVTIKGIVSDNGTLKVKLDSGETVSASDLSYSSADEGMVYSMILDMGTSAGVAETLINGFDAESGMSGTAYALGVAEAYSYGSTNMAYEEITKDGFAIDLAESQRKLAYDLGKEDSHKVVVTKQKALDTAKNEAKKTIKGKRGKVIMEGSAEADTSIQKQSLNAIKALADLSPIEFHVFKSEKVKGSYRFTMPDGTVRTANGWYVSGTNEIWVDLNSGNHGEGTMLYTVAHEISHYIRDWSPSKWKVMADVLMEEYHKNGVDVERLIQRQLLKVKKKYKGENMPSQTQLREEAYEEVVCDAMTIMLQDGTILQKLAEIKQKDKSLWQKIGEAIKKFLEDWGVVYAEYKDRTPDTAEAQILQSMEGAVKKLQDLYAEAFADANETYSAVGTLNTNAVRVTADGTIMLQQRHYEETGRDTLYDYLSNQYGTEDADQLIETIDNINSVMDEIKRDNPNLKIFSEWQSSEILVDDNGKPIFTTSINNGDYKLNQDFSRVCKKRRQLDFVLNLLAEDPEFSASYLTKKDFVAINNAIKKHGFEIACALCFVDSKRFRQAEWADSFANTWNDILESVMVEGGKPTPFNFATNNPNMADEGIQIDVNKSVSYRKWSDGKATETRTYKSLNDLIENDGNANVKTIARLIIENPNLRHTFRGADIIASKGFDSMQKLAPDVRNILDGWGGSSVPKPSSSDASYDSSILNIDGYNEEAAYAMGGARMNSFSDFMAHMFFDYCEAFADLSAKKLPMQSYTKELIFARLFGKLGGKINMSGIAAIRENTLPLTESKKNGITKTQAEANAEIEKRFAGLDVSRLTEHLQKDVTELTEDDLEQFLDMCDYLWADESIDMVKATLLQSGILYDRLSESKQAECYELLKEGKFDEAFMVAGKNNVDTEYAKHIGTIVVGVSDAHIRKLLRDPTIRMVIPYHKSGLNPAIAKLLKISVYKDYTDVQNTGILKKGAKKRVNLAEKTIKSSLGLKDFDFYQFFGKTIDGVTYDGRAVADKYLDWCENGFYDEEVGEYVYYTTKKQGYILAKDLHKQYKIVPKFDAFKGEINYYKVLEDFDCYNTITGEHSPQGAVEFLQKGLPEDYKQVLVEALKEEQSVQDKFRDHLDNQGLRDEIMAIVRKNGYEASDGIGIGKSVSEVDYKAQERDSIEPRNYSVTQIKDMFNEWNSDKDIAVLADKVFTKLESILQEQARHEWSKPYPIRFTSASYIDKHHYSGLGETSHGIFTPSRTDELYGIVYNLDYFKSDKIDDQRRASVLLHEVIHACTVSAMKAAERNVGKYKSPLSVSPSNEWDEDVKAGLTLLQIFEQIRTEGYRTEYGQSSAYEMVAELANPEFRQFLKKQSLWDRIVDAIKRILGITSKNALDSTSAALEKILDDANQGKGVSSSNPPKNKDVRYMDRDGDVKDATELTEEDARYLLECVQNGILSPSSYIPLRRNTPSFFIDVVTAHSNGTYVIKDYPMAVTVEHLTQNMEEEDGLSYGNRRPHELSIDDIVTISRKMGDPSYIVLQNNRRYAEVISFYNRQNKKVVVSIAAAENKEERSNNYKYSHQMNGYADGFYNIIVTQYEPDSLEKYLKDNEVVYDKKKMNGRYQVGSGRIVTVTHDTPFIEDIITHTSIKSQERDPDFSNRTILANALDGATQNPIERQKLKEYKEKISLIDAEEKKLQEVNAKLKDLYFAKGSKDTVRIKKLQDAKTRISNRISTFDKQLLRLEASKPLMDILQREKELVRKKEKAKASKAMSNYKERVLKREKVMREHYQESRSKAIEGRNRTMMRGKIKRVVSDLNQYLLKGNKNKRVMKGLQQAVASALDAINMDTVSAEARIAELQKQIERAKSYEKIQELQGKIDNIKEQGGNLKEKLDALKSAYASIINDSSAASANYKEEAQMIHTRIESVMEKVGNTPLRDMSLSQLEAVYDMYKMVLTTVRNVNTIFKEGKAEDLEKTASMVMSEVDLISKHKTERFALAEEARSYTWKELKPVYAFERIGSKTLLSLFWETRRGEDVYAVDINEAKQFADAAKERHGYNEWDMNEIHEFKMADGRTFPLTLQHMMSIYAYSKRNQALPHMRKGGFVFDNNETFKRKKGVLKRVRITEEAYRIDEDLLNAIRKELGDKTKYVDEMQAYLSEVMGAKGNEVSNIMWGIDLFKEKYYFPLKSSEDFLFEANTPAQETSLKNAGMTKETVPGASNPIVLSNFEDVWASHVNKMSLYHAFVLPIDTLNKVHNYAGYANKGASVSVTTVLNGAFGNSASEYISKFIKDLNGGTPEADSLQFISDMTSKFKKTAVAASMSTVVQQPTAVLRAMALVNPKYFVGKPTRHAYEELKQYAPIAIIKEMGGFDMGGGRQTADWLNSREYKGWGKVKGFFTDSRYRDDAFMFFATKADELGWSSIWNAVKREVKATTDLNVGSKEYFKKCAERFNEVIVYTQVYDSTLSRSGFMRSKHSVVRMATAFLGEPTTSVNMLYNAVLQSVRGGSKWKAVGTIGAVYASIIASSALASLVYALRDDDDDESYLEKYLEQMGSKLRSEVFLHNAIPFIKDVASIAAGWEVARTDMANFQSLKDAIDSLSSDSKSDWRKVEDFVGAVASFFGIPAKNLIRTTREFYNGIRFAFDDIQPTKESGMAFVRGITGKEQSKSKKLYDAMVNDDEGRLGVIEKNYKDQDALNTAIKKAIYENDPIAIETASKYINGNLQAYESAVNALVSKGFDRNVSADAIQAIVSKVKSAAQAEADGETEEYNKKVQELIDLGYDEEQLLKDIGTVDAEPSDDTEKAESIYRKDDYITALESGNTTMANTIKADIISTEMANGSSREKAEEKVKGYEKGYIKDSYVAGQTSSSKATLWLKTNEDMTDDEAYWEMKKWKVSAEHDGEEGYSYSKYAEFLDAVDQGNTVTMNKCKSEFLTHPNGKTNKEVLSNVASSITTKYKPLYLEASPSERARLKQKLLNAYALLGYSRYKKSKDIDKWLKD